MYKEKDKARLAYDDATSYKEGGRFSIDDDFGQRASFFYGGVHGALFEDLELVERARIERSLAEERCKVKLMEAAKTDAVIGAAIRKSQGAPVLTPMGGFRS